MPAVILNGDFAGGAITATQTTVTVNGRRVVCVGDPVAPHGLGIHGGATMVQGSSRVFINGRSVCRNGDLASCGHPAVATYTLVLIG